MTRAEDRAYMIRGYPVRFCRICGGHLLQPDSHDLRWCCGGRENQSSCGAIYKGVFAGMGEEEKSFLDRLADFGGQLADFEKRLEKIGEDLKVIGRKAHQAAVATMVFGGPQVAEPKPDLPLSERESGDEIPDGLIERFTDPCYGLPCEPAQKREA